MNEATREGFLYGLAAYLWWGLVPLYFHWLGNVSPFDILAHRIVWSTIFISVILTLARRWPEAIRCFRTPSLLLPLIVSALLVAYNWGMYILGVYIKDIVQASLGYFILPLVSIALGMVIFRERLRPLQKLAIGFAGVGVALLTWDVGTFPWLALALALSFSVYGMIRKPRPRRWADRPGDRDLCAAADRGGVSGDPLRCGDFAGRTAAVQAVVERDRDGGAAALFRPSGTAVAILDAGVHAVHFAECAILVGGVAVRRTDTRRMGGLWARVDGGW